MSPGLRALVGVTGLILALILYAGLVAAVGAHFTHWPIWAQTLIYLVIGIAWVPLCYPLMVWILTGRWRRSKTPPPPQ